MTEKFWIECIGQTRRTYPKDHRPVLYHTMLLNGSPYPHLLEVGRTAESRMQVPLKKSDSVSV